jgi:serine/threonine protein kinase/Tfp pilus assembly protein PilF
MVESEPIANLDSDRQTMAADRLRLKSSSRPARRAVSSLIAGWVSPAPLDALALLEEHPELKGDKSAVLDLAYEEYCRRIEAGESLDPDAFANRFVVCRRSLRRLLEVHSLLAQNVALIHLAEARWPEVGQQFQDYHLVELLGAGAVSRVYLATERRLGDRPVVLKISLHGVGEAHLLGRLRHPHIVPVYCVARDPATGLSALVMPYLGRTTLFDLLDETLAPPSLPRTSERILAAIAKSGGGDHAPDVGLLGGGTWISPEQSYVEGVLRLTLQAADALAYTHGQGILHCDIKPSNVLLAACGKAFLLDFDLAFDPAAARHGVGGTLPYMAPEQLQVVACRRAAIERAGPAAVDTRTDVFSFGVMLYELLTGELPFGPLPREQAPADLARELLRRQQLGHDPARRRNRDVSAELDRLISRCLHWQPAARPASAAELRELLHAALAARSAPIPQRRRIHRRAAVAAGIGLVGVAAWATWSLAARGPNAEITMAEGLAAFERGQYALAIRRFNQLLEIEPGSPKALFLRGRSYAQIGNLQAALHDLQAAGDRGDGHGLACIGYCLALQGEAERNPDRYPEAIELFEKAVAAGLKTPGLSNDLGFCHLRQSESGESSQNLAEKYLLEALQLSPNFQPAHHNLAVLDLGRSVRQQKFPDLRHINSALRAGPVNPELLLDAACVYAAAVNRAGASEKSAAIDRCLAYCRDYLQAGGAPSLLSRVPTYCPQLAETPWYRALPVQAEATAPVSRTRRLVEPLGAPPPASKQG